MSRPTQPPSSTALKTPINDRTHEGMLIEKGLLERRLILLTIQEVKLRAALELATGVPWDSTNIADLDGDKLEEVVAQNMAHGLNITIKEARQRVRENKEMTNPSQSKGEKLSSSPPPSNS